MNYRITDEDRNTMIYWLDSKGIDGKPGPANWLRAMVGDLASALGLPYADDEGIPYTYDDYEQVAYSLMMNDEDFLRLWA